MLFKHPLHFCANLNRLLRITKKIANQSHAAGISQLYQNRDVRDVISYCRMRRMPCSLPTEYGTFRPDLDPFRIEFVTGMTDPFGSKLKGRAMLASLNQKAPLSEPFPERG